MRIKYIHIRNRNDNNTIASKGGTTVAYGVDGGNVVFAFSRCGPLDAYSKKQGRVKATGRLKSKSQSGLFELDEKLPVVDQVISEVQRQIETTSHNLHGMLP